MLFKIGILADILLIMLSVSGMYFSKDSMDGYSQMGKIFVWLIPLAISILILLALFLKSKDKLMLANILLWIPATPFVIGLLITAFLALVFNLFGKSTH